MKKQSFSLLLVITGFFVCFTIGFFFGKNQANEYIYLSVIPTDAGHDFVAATIVSEETVLKEVSFPIDINSAGIDELTALPGIGETLAERILKFRNLNGPFARPEELLNVEGIGAGKLEKILDYIVTGG